MVASSYVQAANGAQRALVSVLLPVWNAERTLRRALGSIFAQSYPHWECVLVDDGSTDSSLTLAAEVAQRDTRLRVLKREHAGIVAALNHGLRHCRGELIARFDADDLMHPERLAHQVALLGARPELEAVGCQVQIFPRRALAPKRLAYRDWLNSLCDEAAIFRDRFVECPVAHPTLMVRSARFKALAYRDCGWAEDYDLVLRLLAHGATLGTVPLPLHAWRDHPARLSRTHAMYVLERFVECKAHHLAQTWLSAHDQYVLWGYGDTGRTLCRALLAEGKRPSRILDVHPGRVGQLIHGVRVLHPDAAHGQPPSHPIVASVSGLQARTELRKLASDLGLTEGEHYVVAA